MLGSTMYQPKMRDFMKSKSKAELLMEEANNRLHEFKDALAKGKRVDELENF